MLHSPHAATGHNLAENPTSSIRNPKQIRKTKTQKKKPPLPATPHA
jgi:hypothetical protein